MDKIIVHRGFKDYGENNIMGIIVALHQIRKVEFDIFFYKNNWILGHDRQSLHIRSESFENLLKTIQDTGIQGGLLVVDIKWDFQYNRHHSFKKALQELEKIIPKFMYTQFDWYFQVSYPQLTPFLVCSYLRGKKGVILEEFSPNIDQDIDYYMVDLRFFCIHDLKQIKSMMKKELIGYTIPNVKMVKYYYHYLSVLSFLVVDLNLSDLKILNTPIKNDSTQC